MTEKETVSLLQFQSSKGIGSVRGKQLIEKFGSAWDAICWARSARHSVPPWAEILRQDGPRRRAETEFKEAQDRGYTLFGYGQAGYPRRLTEIPDPPLVLFVEGEASLAASNTLSVVGTRRMTPYGAAFCKALIEDLKAYRPTLVSGFAEGIDITVQMAAVEAGLATVACLAHGLGATYPAVHTGFRKKVVKQGALVTEFWREERPIPSRFVRRNRIIAGLSSATLVIQSASTGGSLITADLAFGYHREVYAVPGRTTDPQNKGCLELIRDHKAQLISEPQDLIDFLKWERPDSGFLDHNPTEKGAGAQGKIQTLVTEQSILFCLQKNGKMTPENVQKHLALSNGQLMEWILRLELAGKIRTEPGNLLVLT